MHSTVQGVSKEEKHVFACRQHQESMECYWFREEKIKTINDYEGGNTVKDITCCLEVAHSTISTILKDKNRVKVAVKASISFNAIITRQWKGLFREIKKLLAIWFDDQIPKRILTSFLLIWAKARSIFYNIEGARMRSRIDWNIYGKSWMVKMFSLSIYST